MPNPGILWYLVELQAALYGSSANQDHNWRPGVGQLYLG